MTHSPPVIRDARPSDVMELCRLLRGLAEYERELENFHLTEAALHGLLFGTPRRAEAILVEAAGQVVGTALFYYTVSTFSGDSGLFLEDLFVQPDHRGQGLGYKLLQHLAARAAAEKCTVIEWRVLNWNQPAIDFYQRIGATAVTKWQVRQLRGRALAALAQGEQHG